MQSGRSLTAEGQRAYAEGAAYQCGFDPAAASDFRVAGVGRVCFFLSPHKSRDSIFLSEFYIPVKPILPPYW